MSASTSPIPVATSRSMQGIVCILIAMVIVVLQDSIMKLLLDDFSVWVLLVSRSVVSLFVLVPLIWYLGAPHRLLTPLWPLHLARAALFVVGFSALYAAFPLMQFAEVSTIFFAAPLITALLASLWLGETIGPHRIGALIVGFVGVLVAMNPAGATFSWAALLPLLCAVCYSLAQTIARRIGDRDSTLTVGLYSLTFAGLLILPAGWLLNQIVDIGPQYRHLQFHLPYRVDGGLLWLLFLGILGMVGYMLMSRAYQVANASLVAPFDYTYLPFATIIGYLFWHEVPTTGTLLGMVLIIFSGLYLGYRELRVSRRRDEAPPSAEAIFVPGAAPPVAPHPDKRPLN